MSPVTHFFTGWVIANCGRLDRRERALVTLACVVPDLDGLGIIPELLTRNSSHPLLWFSDYHHSLHTLAFCASRRRHVVYPRHAKMDDRLSCSVELSPTPS